MIRLTVFGEAQPAGSKRAFIPKGWTRPVVTDANPKSREWKDRVAAEAGKAMAGKPALDGPLRMTLAFYRARPAGHYGTGKRAGMLKPGAPTFPTTKPDLTKQIRGTEDALLKICFRDDSQVVEHRAIKLYGEQARVEIIIEQLTVQQLAFDARPGQYSITDAMEEADGSQS